MDTKEFSEDEEKNAEDQKTKSERGFFEQGKERFYEFQTPYGDVKFITAIEEQMRIFRNMAILHGYISSGYEVDPKHVNILILDPFGSEHLVKWFNGNVHPSSKSYVDRLIERAHKYFIDNLALMFTTNMQSYVDEAFFHALTKTVNEETDNPPQTDSAIFSGFAKLISSRMKERLDIKKASGRKPKRTDEQIQAILMLYESILPLIREAKKDFTNIKGKRGWVESIKSLHPQVPVEIIEKLDQKGVTPSEMALAWAAGQFNEEPTEYLRQELIKARKNK